jgi:hypothetical protein
LEDGIIAEETGGGLALIGTNAFGLFEVSLDSRQEPRDGLLIGWVGLQLHDDLLDSPDELVAPFGWKLLVEEVLCAMGFIPSTLLVLFGNLAGDIAGGV